MLKDDLNKLIMESMKAHDTVRTETLRAIKTAIMQWETAKENVGKTYDEGIEINILRKLSAQYKDTAEMCNDGKHNEMVAEAKASMAIVDAFLPAPVDEATIYTCFVDLKGNGLEAVKKNMGIFVKEIKGRYPSADGKLVAQVVQKNLE